MYIKAKYPKMGREWYRQGVQGFGSTYGGNQVSDVTNLDTRLSDGLISRISTSYMFGGNIVSVYVNNNSGNELVFTNESVFIIDSSTLNITEIDTQRALEFINESEWVSKAEADPATLFIDRVSADSGVLDNQTGLDTIDEGASLLMLPNAYKDGTLYSVLPQDGTGDFDVVRGSGATRVNSSGIIETITGVNTPRIDYTSGNPVLLVEPQSTNLLTISEDFSANYWTKSGSPIITNNQPSPDGENNAWEFLATSNSSRLQRFHDVLTAGTYTQSIFVKYKDGDVRMNFKNNRFGGSQVFLITSSGVVEETPNANISVEEYSDGWFRISATYTANGTQTSFLQMFGDLGTPKNSFYIFGAQLEEQSKATSYIKTEGAIATRLADTVIGAGSTDLINSTEGVLYFEGSGLFNGGSNRIISLSDETNDNLVQFRFDTDSGRITSFIRGNGGSYAIKTIIGFTQADNHKIALAWDATSLRIYIDGVQEGSVATNDLPVGLTTFNLSSATGVNNFVGNVKDLRVYSTALTDAELITLTTI